MRLHQKAMSTQTEYFIVQKNDMENFMERCMLTVGTQKTHAQALAKCLIEADYRGHYSHGLNRLGISILKFSVLILNLIF